MSYRDNLKIQIKELEDRISKSKNDSEEHVAYLEKLLNTLKLKEFSEDMVEENNKILLKGQYPLTYRPLTSEYSCVILYA